MRFAFGNCKHTSPGGEERSHNSKECPGELSGSLLERSRWNFCLGKGRVKC